MECKFNERDNAVTYLKQIEKPRKFYEQFKIKYAEFIIK